ncbi:DNA-binding protein, partial [Dysosmobacter welbionis]
GPRPGPALCRPKVAEPPRQAVAGRGRRGHGSRIPRPVRHLGRGHRPQCGGVEPPQRGAGGGGRLRALRGG